MAKGDSSPPISMFFCQSEIDKTMQSKEKDDKSTLYIIHQNNVLQTKYMNLLAELNDLKVEKDLLEDDNDKLQKSKTCLQGHVKNEYIRANNYKTILKHKSKHLSLFLNLFFAHNAIATIYMIIPFLAMDPDYTMALIISVMTVHVASLYYGVVYFRRTNDQDVEKLIIENTEIEKSNKYLEELVDNF